MPWDTDADGQITLCPLIAFGTSQVGAQQCGLRLAFLQQATTLRKRGEFLQLGLTPKQALELAEALRLMAENAAAPEN